jgi:hypothetical protein
MPLFRSTYQGIELGKLFPFQAHGNIPCEELRRLIAA